MNSWFFLFLIVHGSISVSLHWLMGTHQPTVYMDEEFHVAQAQRFCNGSLEWDPKITTPPGLYLPNVLVSLAFRITGFEEAGARVCAIDALRFLNVIFALLNYWIVYSILESYESGKRAKKTESESTSFKCMLNAFEAFTIVQFPNLHFYTMMYYTDPGSVFCLLLLLRLHLSKQADEKRLQLASFVVGFLSLAFRQTNLVWLFCLAAQRCLTVLSQHYRKATSKKTDNAEQRIENDFPWEQFSWLLRTGPRVQFSVAQDCVLRNLPHVANALLGVLFVKLNGGVALGHKEAHELAIHSVQLCYLAFFTGCYCVSLIGFRGLRSLWQSMVRAPLRFAAAVVATSLAVQFNSLVHPFVLADNRHYVFYMHSRLLSKPIARLALSPLYTLAAVALWQLQARQARAFRLNRFLFALCAALSVVTHKLIEPRYFVASFLIFRVLLRPEASLQTRWSSMLRILFELIGYVLVQIVTVYIFFYKPFTSNGELQRFMW